MLSNEKRTDGTGETDGNVNLLTRSVRGQTRYVLDSTANGKRQRRFFRTASEGAKALKEAKQDRADLGRAWGSLSARQKADVMSILEEVQEAGMSLRDVWNTVKSLPNSPQGSTTLGEAVKEVLAEKKTANCRPRHIGNLKWYLGLFIRGRESLPVSSIGSREIETWFAVRQESPRAKKGHVSLLSCLFAYCWRRRYIPENPVTRLAPVHIDRGTPSTLTVAQCSKALEFTRTERPKLLGWLALTLFCGMRPDSEADFVSWKAINLKRGRIVVGRSKLRQVAPRIIDLSFCPPAAEWLRVAKKLKSPLPIHFESRRRAVRALRAHLGFKRWPQDVLRHTAASNLLAFHQDAGKVAAFLGNSAGVLLRDYKALVFKEDAEKWMKLRP
jgi:hypothetical protein